MRARGLLPVCLFLSLVVGCGSDGGLPPIVPFEGAPGVPVDPGNPNPTPPPNPTPTPTPAPAVTFDAQFIDLTTPGAFPSDVVGDGNGSLYTVDDAQIPATVLRFPFTGGAQATPSVTIAAADLIDSDGTQPAVTPNTIDFGGGLFGAFTGDLEVVFERWLLVTVGAGNSASAIDGAPVRLANLLVIDMQAGEIVQTINLGWSLPESHTLSDGSTQAAIPQSLPSQVTFVPDLNGSNTGRIYVAMGNGAGSASGLTLWHPGTVQIWRADFTRAEPIEPDLTGLNPQFATRTFVSENFNPVSVRSFRNRLGLDYLLLTNAGASRFDANFNAVPETETVIEVLDLTTFVWRPSLAQSLGAVLPATQRAAIGRDATGRPFAAFTSQTFSAAYLFDLSGLDVDPPVAGRGLLRTIDLAAGGSTTIGSGFHPGVGLTNSARTLVTSRFLPAQLQVVSLPGDVANGSITVDPAPFDGNEMFADDTGGLGALVVPRNNVSDVYVITNGTFDMSFAPLGNAHIGTLTTRDGLR
ncbi:MAG: hypothetical protein AAGD14_07730 [Planctomycetota bacterium]